MQLYRRLCMLKRGNNSQTSHLPGQGSHCRPPRRCWTDLLGSEPRCRGSPRWLLLQKHKPYHSISTSNTNTLRCSKQWHRVRQKDFWGSVFVANRMASKCWFGDTESEEHWAGRHGCVLSSKSYLYEFIDLFRDCSRIQHSTAGYKILKGGHAWSFWVSASCWLLQSQ